jgi:outer membrane protein
VRTVECVASGDVVFVDLDYIMSASKLYAAEGKALEAKMQEFQTRAAAAQEGWAKKEQSLANEYNKLQNDAAKLQQEYEKGLITTLKAQERQAELQKKGESIQSRMAALQTTVQTEGTTLQTEEQALAEEQVVLMNRFQELARQAINEINADRRYKMIINAVSVVDADPTLNISDLVLMSVDALYEAGSLE